MIAVHLTPTDIIQLRFAFSPILEATISFRLLKKERGYPFQYQQWIEEARRALHDEGLPYMNALIGDYSYVPDFLTPTPTAPGVGFEEDLKRLCATPTPIVQQNLQFLMRFAGKSDILCHALAHPRETIEALIEELRLYWSRTLEHHWSRMMMIIENDILYRAREQALYGTSDMLNGIHPRIIFDDKGLRIDKTWKWGEEPCATLGYHYDVSGRGLQIVPTFFSANSLHWQFTDGYQPMVMYGARGIGLWHHAEPDNPEEALQITMGSGRSRVLYALTTPRSTSELAYILDITSGAVSQHLGRLNQAGLVESSRVGKRVFYRLSKRGQNLIDVFS